MDKEIVKELEKMVLENKYKKTLNFSGVRCSKCINSLSGVCNLHTRDKINMLKEVLIKNLPNEEKNKNTINVFTNPKNQEQKFFIQKENITDKNFLDLKKKYNFYQLVDCNGKKCNDVSEMEFSFDDLFE